MKSLSLLTALFAMIATNQATAAEIIAHRGASHDAPENTIAALKLGYAQGADAGECDVYLTKDGKIVVMHDKDTLRTGGVKYEIANSDSSALRGLDVGKWGAWGEKSFSEKIPFLEEALALIPQAKRLFIEIKGGPEILPELKRVLAASGKKPEQTPLIGFDLETVRQAKRMMPGIEVCWLSSSDSKTKEYPPIERLIEKAKAAGLDGLDLHFGFPIDAAFVNKVKAAGLKLYTWTVDDPAVAREEVKLGVDGITTNRPEWLRKQIGN